MDNKITLFTFFFTFLFFTVSASRLAMVDPAARLAVDPVPVHAEDDASSKTSNHESSNILLPGQKPNSYLDQNSNNNNNNRLPETEKATTNDLTPQANFSRFHPINRHFHGKVPPRVQRPRRPCTHPMHQHNNPRIERSGETENEDVVNERMINAHPKASRGDFQSNWFKAKHHHYGPRRYHGSNDNRNDQNDNDDIMMMNANTKRAVDREKVRRSSVVRQQQKEKQQQKKKKREEEAGLMKNIRKFLKHTFD